MSSMIFQYTDRDGDQVDLASIWGEGEKELILSVRGRQAYLPLDAAAELRDALTTWLDMQTRRQSGEPAEPLALPLPLVSMADSFAKMAEDIRLMREGWAGVEVILARGDAVKAVSDANEAARPPYEENASEAAAGADPVCRCGHGWTVHAGPVNSCTARVSCSVTACVTEPCPCDRYRTHDISGNGGGA